MTDFAAKHRGDLTDAVTDCPIEASDDLYSILQHLKAVLDASFGSTGICVAVTPVPYPSCGKLPVLITLNQREHHLLWYYRNMSMPDLLDELYNLFFDVDLIPSYVPPSL